MKKFLAMILGALLVFGFAVSAFAIHAEIPSDTQAVVAKGSTQLTLGGELRMRGWYQNNVVKETIPGIPGQEHFLPSDGKGSASASWYDTRVRLSLKADVSKNTTGFVHLETNNGKDSEKGDAVSSDGYVWGNLNTKSNSDLKILEAWILHKGSGLLGIPAGIKVGHMPLALGEAQFLDLRKFGTDAIVFFMDPTKELHIGLLTAKVRGNSSPGDTDIDAYVALMTYKLDPKNTVGINYTWINSANVFNEARDPKSLNFSNLGLHANGNVSGLMYRTEVDFQWGKVERGVNATTDLKQRGLGIFAELGYKVDPVTIKARYGYGSGDKYDSNTGDTGSKIEEFQTLLGRDIHHTFIYEFILSGAATSQLSSLLNLPGSTTASRSRGLANTSMYSLGLSFAPAKNLTASIDYYLLRANKFWGDANDGRRRTGTSKNIGSELDLRLAYKIDRNLTYAITAGYFWAGGFWEDQYDEFYPQGVSKKNVPAMMHALTLSF